MLRNLASFFHWRGPQYGRLAIVLGGLFAAIADAAEYQSFYVLDVGFDGVLEVMSGYTIALMAALGALLLALLAGIRLFLKEDVTNLFGSARFRYLLYLGGTIMVVVVSLTANYTLDVNRRLVLEQTGDELRVVVRSARDRVHLWVDDRVGHLERLAADRQFRALASQVGEKLEAPDSQNNDTQKALLKVFEDNLQGDGEFQLVNPQGEILASPDTAIIGLTNPLFTANGNLAEEILAGDRNLLTTQGADKTSESSRATLTEIYALVPVEIPTGPDMIIVQKLNVTDELSALMTEASIGTTGESYVIDNLGRMLTRSSFLQFLKPFASRLGAIAEPGLFEVRDPGLNLLKDGGDTTLPSPFDFTAMTTQLLKLRSSNVSGPSEMGDDIVIQVSTGSYRDYRGVDVIGAWTWDDRLDVGIATEIDILEVLSGHYVLRLNILVICFVALMLAWISILLTLGVGRRATRELRKQHETLEQTVLERTRELEISKQQQGLAFQGGDLGFFDYDTKSKEIQFNERFAELFGWEDGETLSLTYEQWLGSIHPDDVATVVTSTELVASGKRTEFEGEVRVVLSDDMPRWVSLKGIATESAGTGKTLHMVGTVQDITDRHLADLALREAELRSRLLLESVGEGIFGVNKLGFVNFINPAACAMLGYEPDELIGSRIHRRIHHTRIDGTEYPESECPMSESSRIGTSHLVKDEILWRKDGEPFHAEYSSVPLIFDEAVQGAVVVFHDVSERKEAEEALKASEQRLNLALQGANAGLWDWSPETGAMVVDELWASMLGYELEEIEARYGSSQDKFFELVHPEDLEPTLAELQQHVAGKTEIYSAEFRMKTASGNWKWVQDIGKASQRNRSGKATRVVGVHLDIDESKALHLELEKQTERMQAIVDTAVDGIIVIDDKGIIQEFSPAAEKIFEYPREEILGKNISTIVPKPFKQDHDSYIARYINTEQSRILNRYVELEGERKSGEIFPVSLSIAETWVGDQRMFTGIARDITEKRAAEKQLQDALAVAESATQAKSDFLANMSHEIRTPMNAIIGMSYLALQTDLSPRQQDYLAKINNASNALLGIINDILDFSKIEAGKLELETIDFRMSDVIDNLTSVVGPKVREKHLEFLVAVDKDVPKNLRGDPLRLGQVLLNLANNAVKFTERGEVILKVGLDCADISGARLRFSLSDTGIGMDNEQVKGLFKPFSQADASTTRKFGGTGLGLSISKDLVEMMRGQISVESELGRGSEFVFTAEFLYSKEKPENNTAVDQDIHGIPVLIVDDNAAARDILKQVAESLTFECMVASNGHEAIDLIKHYEDAGNPFRVVFADWKMPEMDGLEFSSKVKGQLDLKNPPSIVLVTAFDSSDLSRKIGKQVECVLSKPITASGMLDAAMVALGRGGAGKLGLGEQGNEYEIAKEVSGANILLVEDNNINQQVATELLERAGMNVDVADNGQIAVRKVYENAYDLVLMDIQMPVMDGLAATTAIRQTIDAEKLPIVAMTANAMAGDRERCIDAGMQDHVAKPITPAELYTALKTWIKPRPELGKVVLSQSAANGDTDYPMPEIEALDARQGLARVGGNQALYIDLIRRFVSSESSAVTELRHAVTSGEFEIAERIAHTTKGVAGNLGASKVQECASRLEAALAEKREDQIEALVDDYCESFHSVAKSLTGYLYELSNIEQTGESTGTLHECVAVLGKLRELLANDDGEAETVFTENKSLLKAHVDHSSLESLRNKVEAFEFDEALEVVNQVQRDLVIVTPSELRALQDLLSADDGDAVEVYEQMAEPLREFMATGDFDALHEAIDNFDFETAVAVLSKYVTAGDQWSWR